MAVGAGTKEAGQVDPVAARQAAQSNGQLSLRLGRSEFEFGGTQRRRDVGKEIIDRFDPDGRQHSSAVFVRMRAVRHRSAPLPD